MQLNEKGYYFAVLVLGLFAAASYQKTVRDKYEAIPTTALALHHLSGGLRYRCRVCWLSDCGMPLCCLSEKGFYGLAYF